MKTMEKQICFQLDFNGLRNSKTCGSEMKNKT